MTPNEIIGGLVYRVNTALNQNQQFLAAVKDYYYYPAIVHDQRLHLWHFPGTVQEISQVFQGLSKNTILGSKLKFPALMNFQPVAVQHEFQLGIIQLRYNLAIVTPVLSEWTTQQREAQAYRLVLRPIEDEFIRQIERSGMFWSPVGRYPYVSAYVPTTGRSISSTMKSMYGDFIDAIELPNFTLKRMNTCNSMRNKIISESKKVTDEIKNLTK
jgi:hypothetical protein